MIDTEELMRLTAETVEAEDHVRDLSFTRTLMTVCALLFAVVGAMAADPKGFGIAALATAVGLYVHMRALPVKLTELHQARLNLALYVGKAGRSGS